MKKKIILITVFIILCLGFVVGVQIIKNKQSGSEKEDENSKKDSLVTGKTFSFEDILKKAKISSVCEIGINVPSSNQKTSLLNYFFTGDDKIQEIQNILSEYEYMESSAKLDDSNIALWAIDYKQSDDRILCMAAYSTDQPDLVQIIFLLENLAASIENTSGWIADHSQNGFFVDSKISDRILNITSDSERLSKKYITDFIENFSALPSMTDFFHFHHEWKNSYINNSTGELYETYTFELSDTEEYALLYCVHLTRSGGIKNYQWRNIFKIELYNSSGKLTETLYDNQEGYEKLMEEINTSREE